MKLARNNKGVSLIGLMVTVVLVVTLTTLVFLWIDPLGQSGDAKDTQRLQAVNILSAAIKDYSLEHKGALPVLGSVTTSSKKVLCTTQSGTNITCGASSEPCLRIADADFYNDNLFQLPIDPDTTNEQDPGFYLQKDTTTGQLIVGACDSYGVAINKKFGLKVSCDAYADGHCWNISDTVAQDCNSVCADNGLACLTDVTYGPDEDDADSGFCALNLAMATSSTDCDTSCSESTIVGNYPGGTSCYYDNDTIDCTASAANYYNICPCE